MTNEQCTALMAAIIRAALLINDPDGPDLGHADIVEIATSLMELVEPGAYGPPASPRDQLSSEDRQALETV